jgi:hypothetical protein
MSLHPYRSNNFAVLPYDKKLLLPSRVFSCLDRDFCTQALHKNGKYEKKNDGNDAERKKSRIFVAFSHTIMK